MLIWVLLSCFSGMIVGPLLIFVRVRREKRELKENSSEMGGESAGIDLEAEETPSTLLTEIKDIIYCLVFGDALDWAKEKIAWKLASPTERAEAQRERQALLEADTWTPAAHRDTFRAVSGTGLSRDRFRWRMADRRLFELCACETGSLMGTTGRNVSSKQIRKSARLS